MNTWKINAYKILIDIIYLMKLGWQKFTYDSFKHWLKGCIFFCYNNWKKIFFLETFLFIKFNIVSFCPIFCFQPEINDRTMNNRLKISLQRIHESLIADETVPGINGAPEERTVRIY